MVECLCVVVVDVCVSGWMFVCVVVDVCVWW